MKPGQIYAMMKKKYKMKSVSILEKRKGNRCLTVETSMGMMNRNIVKIAHGFLMAMVIFKLKIKTVFDFVIIYTARLIADAVD